MAMPNLLKDFNAFYQGISYMGVVKQIKLPTLKRKLEKWRGGGMPGSVSADMGLDDELAIEHTYGGFVSEIVKDFGNPKHNGVLIRFAGAFRRDDTAEVMAVEVVVRGRHEEIEMPEGKAGGDGGETKVKTVCSYYKLIVNGQTIVEIDIANCIEIVNGQDLYEALRPALGL